MLFILKDETKRLQNMIFQIKSTSCHNKLSSITRCLTVASLELGISLTDHHHRFTSAFVFYHADSNCSESYSEKQTLLEHGGV